jgi:hypothetical protein
MKAALTIFAALAVLAGPALGQTSTTTPKPQPTPAPSSSDRSSPSPRTTPGPSQSAPVKRSGASEDKGTVKQPDRTKSQTPQ